MIKLINDADASLVYIVNYTEHCSVGPTNFIETIVSVWRGWRFLNLDF